MSQNYFSYNRLIKNKSFVFKIFSSKDQESISKNSIYSVMNVIYGSLHINSSFSYGYSLE